LNKTDICDLVTKVIPPVIGADFQHNDSTTTFSWHS
jgi:hypothetical protein